jgi:carotenoid cleavage dioxygenase-like enzyme
MTHVAKYVTEKPYFFFHTVNAFDDGDDVAIDIMTYEDLDLLQHYRIDAFRGHNAHHEVPTGGKLTRYRLSNISKAIDGFAGANKLGLFPVTTERRISEELIELARMNDLLNPVSKTSFRYDKNYKFVYATALTRVNFVEGLIKINVADGTDSRFKPELNSHFTEPFFVPRPTAEGETPVEDDGVLLSIMYSSVDDKSYLMIINPKDMTEICRAQVPRIVPAGFHGVFLK